MQLGCIGNSTLGFRDGRYYYEAGEWGYVEALADRFERVDICAPVVPLDELDATEARKYATELSAANATVIAVFDPRCRPAGVKRFVAQQLRIRGTLQPVARQWDFGFVMYPGWLAAHGWRLHRRYGWPYAISVRGDWHTAISYRRTFSRWLLPVYRRVVRAIERRLLEEAVVRIASGYVLADRYPKIADSFILSANLELREEDIREREDTCESAPASLLYVGKLVRRKGVDTTIRALRRLVDSGYDVELTIVGEGPETPALTDLSAKLDVQHRVRFSEYEPDRRRLLDTYHRHDVFVIAARSEGFPRVVYEAMSQGLPVVCTRVGGITNVLTNEEDVLLAPPDDDAALAAAIARVLTDVAIRRRVIRGGLLRYRALVRSAPRDRAIEAITAAAVASSKRRATSRSIKVDGEDLA